MTSLRGLLLVPAVVITLPAQDAPARMTDAEAEAFARQALSLQGRADQEAALRKLRAHHFRTSRIQEREFVLYAQGILEDRLGNTMMAAAALRKLEVTWPQSRYLLEVQPILALRSIERRRFKEAELRLQKALYSDIPVESKRKVQELLLWALSEQDRLAEGLPIVKNLQPLGASRPSERGLVAILETFCLAKDKTQAEATRGDLRKFYPASRYNQRADLAWARLLGTTGDAPGSAELLRSVINQNPGTGEADEARLALATLLSEGKLQPKEAGAFPSPQKLLGEIRQNDRKGDFAHKSLFVQLRLQMKQGNWKEALDTSAKLLKDGPGAAETTEIGALRLRALRSWAQQMLDKKTLAPLLPYLDKAGINALLPEQRTTLVRTLAQKGLPEPARIVAELSPAAEGPLLLKAASEAASPEANPEETLKLLSARGESPSQALKRAQVLVVLGRWNEAKAVLRRAEPGAERVASLLACLQRPAEKQEGPAGRLREAERSLAQLPEKGPDREPIAILVADLRAKAGNWRGALDLYPQEPQKGNRGWVALMRATCLLRLGRKDAAKTVLKTAQDEPDFRMERQTLGKQIGL
ncbi:MAG TPA: hypothetical protein PKM35_06890 [Holophaga sp.]|nr:hypothetical protein [Holophaga sp.]HPS66527.1 hypothetical protein [Holophaga sp.]